MIYCYVDGAVEGMGKTKEEAFEIAQMNIEDLKREECYFKEVKDIK